ncbi:hypothetical protein ABXJ56_02315 [Microbacterium chocolatum]|uniref:hypothetical protein n=1 Tax=Microbacterium aurantiacum TaxID=162393 RepID=UPI00338EC7D8
MRARDERIEELIAAAVADDLTPVERAELDDLRAVHPWIDDEIASLSRVAARAAAEGSGWRDLPVSAALRERVLGSASAVTAAGRSVSVAPRRWFAPALAAACLVVGIVTGFGVASLTAIDPEPSLAEPAPTGPVGTLGAVEPVAMRADPGIDVDADVIAHTWGTEALLEVEGLAVGETYAVVFVGEDGREYSAGEMLGSEVPIVCRLNAALLREDAVRMEIRDAGSDVVAGAELPSA